MSGLNGTTPKLTEAMVAAIQTGTTEVSVPSVVSVTHHALQVFEPGKFQHPGAQLACLKDNEGFVPSAREWGRVQGSEDRFTRDSGAQITCPVCLRIGARGRIFALHGVVFAERRNGGRWRVWLRMPWNTIYDSVLRLDGGLEDVHPMSRAGERRQQIEQAADLIRAKSLRPSAPLVWLSDPP